MSIHRAIILASLATAMPFGEALPLRIGTTKSQPRKRRLIALKHNTGRPNKVYLLKGIRP